MLRRSDFIAATYALSFVFANFGIAIAARIPMMTTTIRSSISVKPFLLLIFCLQSFWWRGPDLDTPLIPKRLRAGIRSNRLYGKHRSAKGQSGKSLSQRELRGS